MDCRIAFDHPVEVRVTIKRLDASELRELKEAISRLSLRFKPVYDELDKMVRDWA